MAAGPLLRIHAGDHGLTVHGATYHHRDFIMSLTPWESKDDRKLNVFDPNTKEKILKPVFVYEHKAGYVQMVHLLNAYQGLADREMVKVVLRASSTTKEKLAEHDFELTSPLVNWSKCLCNLEPCLCAV